MKCSLGISNFFEDISSLSHSIVFLYFFALISEAGFLIFPCYSLELCIQMGISFLFSLPFASFLFSAICQASLDYHFAFLHSFSSGWSWSQPPVQCHEPLSIVLQVLCLPDLIFESVCHFQCIIVGDLIYVIPEWLVVFPTFFILSLNLLIWSSWSEP